MPGASLLLLLLLLLLLVLLVFAGRGASLDCAIADAGRLAFLAACDMAPNDDDDDDDDDDDEA